MGAFSSWVDSNWFNVIQTVGIVGGLSLTRAAANREARAKEIENLLALSEQHRELWKEIPRRKNMARVFQRDTDPLSTPATVEETEFLNLVIVHFQTGWCIAKTGGLMTLAEMKADVRNFFNLPLPCAVWENTKHSRNKAFVRFVEKAMKSGS